MIRSILVIFSLLFSLVSCAEEAKYTREECIVRINIDWADFSEDRKESMIRAITNAIRTAPDMGFNRIQASSAIQGSAREFIYYQYKYDCERKIINTKKILSYVRDSVEGLPELDVDPRSFKPNVDTIRSSGPWWKDEEKPIGNKVNIDGQEFIEVR